MPFDTIAAKKTINSLQAHRQQPGGELMERAAGLLQDALADAITATSAVRASEAEAIKARRSYDDAMLEIKTLREQGASIRKHIAVLQEVAATKKGAANKARDYLASIGQLPATAAAPVEPAKPEGSA